MSRQFGTLKLSSRMLLILHSAPERWMRIWHMDQFPTIEALERRGYVKIRSEAGTSLMRSFQWKITPAGRVLDGRHNAEHKM